MEPIISIVVPVYNVEKYLKRCIESLLKQDISEKEIILIDDGSKDSSPQICDQYCAEYPFIRVLHKKNEGLGYARNSGISLARGKYVSFVDSDDEIEENHYVKLVSAAEHSRADACLSGMTDVYENSSKSTPHPLAGNIFDKIGIMNILLPSMIGYDLQGGNYSGMSVCRGIYKRALLIEKGIVFPSEREYISEDVIFDIKFMKNAECVVIVDGAGYYYYHNAGSLTTKYKENRFEDSRKLFLYEAELIKECANYKNLWNRIASMFLSNIRVSMMHETIYKDVISSYRRISEMLRDKEVQKLVREYDYSKMPKKQKYFCVAIKMKMVFVVQLMATMQGRKYKKALF